MAIEHSTADVELPVGCRRSVEAWKAAHCCSQPGERQEASIEATSILKRLRSLRATVGEVAKCVAPIGDGSSYLSDQERS